MVYPPPLRDGKHHDKWYHPETQGTGWTKNTPKAVRRQKMLMAHGNDNLAAGKAMQALANITQDPETKREARADALYFYRENKRVNQPKITRQKMRISPQFKRLR